MSPILVALWAIAGWCLPAVVVVARPVPAAPARS
jgi:hypothetical protein